MARHLTLLRGRLRLSSKARRQIAPGLLGRDRDGDDDEGLAEGPLPVAFGRRRNSPPDDGATVSEDI